MSTSHDRNHTTASPPLFAHLAFIRYSRSADSRLASRLQSDLEQLLERSKMTFATQLRELSEFHAFPMRPDSSYSASMTCVDDLITLGMRGNFDRCG